jgi:hypothetical protein
VHLGYPELAAGDVYKAFLLIEAGLDYESPHKKLRLSYGMLVLVWSDPWNGDFSRD